MSDRPRSVFSSWLPKSPESEWVPYLSRRPLDTRDLEAVAKALGLTYQDALALYRGGSIAKAS